MGFAEKTFDLRKFVRAVHKQPDASQQPPGPDTLTPEDLSPCLFDVYIQILRHETIDISKMDIDDIGEGGIDDLENVLDNSPANGLFHLSDVFRQLEPAVAPGRVFI